MSARADTSESLRVCLVSAAYLPYPSGVSEHVAHLGAALAAAGHDVSVLTTRFETPVGAADESGGLRVTRVGRAVRIPGNGSYATLPVAWGLPGAVRAHIRALRPDIVHCHGFLFPEIAYWALGQCVARPTNGAGSLEAAPRGVVSLMSAGLKPPPLAGRLYRSVFRGATERVSAVIALSRWAEECAADFLPGPLEIVPSGVDVERFRPDLEPLPEGDRGPSVLFVGRLDERKGIDVLLRSMPLVLLAEPEARLVVVGDGPRAEGARVLAGELGIAERVDFRGRVSRADLPRYYCGADVFASPALGGESFGIVLVEAMAAGTAVVASRIRGYDEVVRESDGVLVPPGDPDSLGIAIAAVLTNRERRALLVESGSARARELAWPRIAAETVRVYTRTRTTTSL